MKCVCGYEYKWFINDVGKMETIGDERFILVLNNLLIFYKNNKKNGKDVYICPKCGTLKIDI